MLACNGRCLDCPHDTCSSKPVQRPTRAAERASWRQDALFELRDLADLYDLDPDAVRLR